MEVRDESDRPIDGLRAEPYGIGWRIVDTNSPHGLVISTFNGGGFKPKPVTTAPPDSSPPEGEP